MDTLPKHNLSISEACYSLGISKSQLYKLVASGVIRPIKIGARTLFNTREVSRFVDALSSGSDDLIHRSARRKIHHRNSK